MTRAVGTWALAGALLVACGAPARMGEFADRPPAARVDDERDIPEPVELPFYKLSHYVNGYLFGPIEDAVDPPENPPARDINSIDEVPDSAWFSNRIGAGDMTVDEIVHGAEINGPPQAPLTIFKAKDQGDSPGFFVTDVRGARYLLKFDTVENPEQQTGTGPVVGRLLWAAGYFAPAEHVVYFARDELVIGEAVAAHVSEADVTRMLRTATRRADGAIRGVASEFVPGKPKGGWSPHGRRADDPNDRIAHEHRRVLRGLRVFSAWLGHTDVKPDNTLDVYVEEDGRHFLRHYLVDFGEALGGHQSGKDQREIGWEHGWDWRGQGLGLVTLGLWVRPWEHQHKTPWKSVGYFGTVPLDPRRWRGRYPYEPFERMDRNDAYWAAKIIARFDRPLIEAAVAQGRFSEPGAAPYLVDTLIARRDAVARAYLDGVTPFDELVVRGDALCGVDLTRRYGYAADGTLEVIGGASYPIAGDGSACIPLAGDGSYHIVRVRIHRHGRRTPPMQIHYKGGEQPHLLGIVRE